MCLCELLVVTVLAPVPYVTPYNVLTTGGRHRTYRLLGRYRTLTPIPMDVRTVMTTSTVTTGGGCQAISGEYGGHRR